MMLSMVLVMITISKASAERISELLDEESSLQNGAEPLSEVRDGEIVFENVSFSYSTEAAKMCLTDINLHIHAGENNRYYRQYRFVQINTGAANSKAVRRFAGACACWWY